MIIFKSILSLSFVLYSSFVLSEDCRNIDGSLICSTSESGVFTIHNSECDPHCTTFMNEDGSFSAFDSNGQPVDSTVQRSLARLIGTAIGLVLCFIFPPLCGMSQDDEEDRDK